MIDSSINKSVIASDTIDAGNQQMREFIMLAESYLATEPLETVEETVAEPIDHQSVLITDLKDLAFRLRAFMETETGDFALGVETGMQRAADMIDNLIKRHTTDGGYIG